jgi:hypothetical protein
MRNKTSEPTFSQAFADKSGEQQTGTAERILTEIISSDVALVVTFNQAIDGVLKNNQKAQSVPMQTFNADHRLRAAFSPSRRFVG